MVQQQMVQTKVMAPKLAARCVDTMTALDFLVTCRHHVNLDSSPGTNWSMCSLRAECDTHPIFRSARSHFLTVPAKAEKM